MKVWGFWVLLCAWAVGQKLDCMPYLRYTNNDGVEAVYLGPDWDDKEVAEQWQHVEDMCSGCGPAATDCAGDVIQPGVHNCEWLSGTTYEEPRCVYKAERNLGFIVEAPTTTGDMIYQTINRKNDVAKKQFPLYDKDNYPAPPTELRLVIHQESNYRVRLRIEDPNQQRFEVPPPWGKLASANLQPPLAPDEKAYHVSVGAEGDPLKFHIKRKEADEISLFYSDFPNFVYEDQYLQLTTGIPSEFMYGFGEHEHTTFKHEWEGFSRFTMYTRPHGVSPGPNLYGHHPFYMVLDHPEALPPNPAGAVPANPVDAEDWKAHGVLLLNANAQEVDKIPYSRPTASELKWQPLLTWRVLGGIFDFYIFMGPTPAMVVSQYLEAIGRPYMIPYWSLGFQLSQYWYGSLDVVKAVYDRMVAAEIPYDVQHHDIDYMEHQKDFTVDTVNYVGLGEWDKEIQTKGMKVVIMLDPALTFGHVDGYNARPAQPDVTVEDYDPTDTGNDLDIWVMIEDKDTENKMVPLVGKVWPDKPQVHANGTSDDAGTWLKWALDQLEARKDDTDYSEGDRANMVKALADWDADDDKNTMRLCHYHLSSLWNFQVHMCRAQLGFPDFWKSSAHIWWKAHLKEFWINEVPFDAIWIDMNEPENFVHGSYNYYVAEDKEDFTWEGGKCPDTRWDYPPYVPREWDYIKHGGVFVKSLCSSATQMVHGTEMRQYDVHSLYGAAFSEPTWESVREITGKRSFVFSRSTYPGVGKYIGHWLGDNWSGWAPLKYSIIGSMEFNMFGIPYVGADVCGFFGDTFADLCMRWTQLGAFYGFWRNHNTKHATPQDPAAFTEEFSVAAKRVHETRYSLLPYIYTLFAKSHLDGSTVTRSLMAEFLNRDANVRIRTADEEFLIGPALLVAPALAHTDGEGEESSKKAKPEVDAYLPAGADWYDFYKGKKFSGGAEVKLHIPLYKEADDDAGERYQMRDIGLFTRSGSIIPMQKSEQNTDAARKNPIDLLISLNDGDQKAAGEWFWDDGDSQDTIELGHYQWVNLEAEPVSATDTDTVITFQQRKQNAWDEENLVWGKITIYGAKNVKTKAHFFRTVYPTGANEMLLYENIAVTSEDIPGSSGERVVTVDLTNYELSAKTEGILLLTDGDSGAPESCPTFEPPGVCDCEDPTACPTFPPCP